MTLDLRRVRDTLQATDALVSQGRIVRAAGVLLEASLPQVALGTVCEIRLPDGRSVNAEVVGFEGTSALLVPSGEMRGICEGCAVIPKASAGEIPVGLSLL